MSRRLLANLISSLLALAAGIATFYISIRYLTAPEKPIDWLVQLCAGGVVAIIIFFLSWGHFQKLPNE